MANATSKVMYTQCDTDSKSLVGKGCDMTQICHKMSVLPVNFEKICWLVTQGPHICRYTKNDYKKKVPVFSRGAHPMQKRKLCFQTYKKRSLFFCVSILLKENGRHVTNMSENICPVGDGANTTDTTISN